MRNRTVTFAAGDGLVEGAGARWAAPVLKAWPRGDESPRPEVISLREYLLRGEGPLGGTGPEPESPALVILGTEYSRAEISQLIDRLQNQLSPALLLVPGRELSEDKALTRLGSGGVLVEAWDADPARLATILYTLGERQHLVHGVARELRITQRSQGGLKGEVDRIHEEMHLASAVQRELLPVEMPKLEGVQFAALFRPVGYVSGDIYDFRRLDDHRVAFLVADAVGHGVPAALLTVALCRSLTSRDRDGDQWRFLEPAEALARLNRDLCARQHTPHRFATAIYGWIDSRTRRVTIAGAGHPPPLVFGPHGTRNLETDGPLLGVFDDGEFTQTSTVLEPGETMVIFTDGMESAFPEGSATMRELAKPTTKYVEHLSRLARRANEPGSTLEEATRELVAMLEDQAGSLHQVDDITAVAIGVPSTAGAIQAAAFAA